MAEHGLLTCLDAPPEDPGWTCIRYDGTGLWCANCRARAALTATEEGSS